MSDELPEGWAWARLGQLGEFGRGKSKHRPRNDPRLFGGPHPFIQTGEVARSGGRITTSSVTYSEAGLAQSKLWPARTVCITIAANIADSALLTFPACFPDSVVGLVCDQNLALPEFIEFFVRTARSNLSAFAPATAQKNINMAILDEVRVPLPPLAEQRRIAAKVEALLARVNAAHERLEKVPLLLKRFRQSVLAAASSGRLTEDWRSEQSKAGSIDSIRGRITGGEWQEPSFDFRDEDDLPDGWNYVALGNLGSWGTGGTPAKSQKDFWHGGTTPWVSPKDMKFDFIDGAIDHLTDAGAKSSGAHLVGPGTLLFVVRGMILAHTFPVGLTTRQVAFNQDLRALRPFPEVHGAYLLWALKAEAMAILFAVKEATHGTLRIESPMLRGWPIPVPPLDEQLEIDRRVRRLLSAADLIEKRVRVVQRHAERLPAAILEKAFSGELVPTEAELALREGRDFESAAEALRRILAEPSESAPKRAAITLKPTKRVRGRPSKAANAES